MKLYYLFIDWCSNFNLDNNFIKIDLCEFHRNNSWTQDYISR